ncbi:M1 family metallopeptidase [Tsuneonella sp. HG222]
MRFTSTAAAAALLAGCATVPDAAAPPIVVAPGPLPASVTSELPRNARPTHYAIEVGPDAQRLTFTGFTAIDLELFETSRAVTLNAVKLNLAKATLTPLAGGTATPMAISLDEGKETATFTAPTDLAPGKYRLAIDYSGKIGTQASGLFALDYPDKRTGKPARGLFTQFETPDAREFAPLFDEPSYKATFSLSAVLPQGEMAVSNMPIESEEALGDGRKRVRFATTPPMSSYLLFYAQGDFERLAAKAADGIEVGIVAPAGSGDTMRPALEYTLPLVGYFNDYFGVDYPLPKLDNVAAPGSSQQFGAMENWGAIMTFEGSLLLDPRLTSPSRIAYLYTTIGHEVAHQWFGNIVTMEWWDDLWLNESFASWMESKSTDHFRPEWSVPVGKVAGRETAMATDGLASTRPIIVRARTADEADQLFDAIAYQKGEAVLTMLEAYAGEDVWRDGLRRYMRAHQFGNARTEELWQAMEAAGAKGLVAVADSFTRQKGVPLVAATVRCEGGRSVLGLTPGQFSRDEKDRVAANPNSWLIPMSVKAADGSLHRIVLDGSRDLDLPGCGPVIVNGGQMSYFRTLYAPEMLAALTAKIAAFDPVDQHGLMRDNLALAEAGYQPYGPAIDLLAAIPADANPVVASAALAEWDKFYSGLDEQADKAELAAVVGTHWTPRLGALGFDPIAGENLRDTELRATLIALLGEMGEETVAAEADRRLALLAADPRALDGPMKQTWLGIAARNADAAQWDFLRGLAGKAATSTERDTLFALLGAAEDEALARKALALAMSEQVGATNAAQILRRVSTIHPDLAYDFALARRAEVEALVDDSSKPGFLAALADGSKNPAMIGKLEALRATLPDTQRASVNRVLARTKQRIASGKVASEALALWLDVNAPRLADAAPSASARR